MAAPVVAGTNQNNSNSSSTSLLIDLPASISAGDLLIAAVGTTGDGATFDWTAIGWTEVITVDQTAGASPTISVGKKVAGASEPSSVTLSTSLSTRHCAISMRITGTGGTTYVSAGALGNNSVNPDPDNLSGLTSDDYLFLGWANASHGVASAVTAWPANMPDNRLNETHSSSQGTRSSLMVATAGATAVTGRDPDAFTHAETTAEWAAATVAVRAGAAPTPARDQHFRGRTNDVQSLNADAGWDAALNVDFAANLDRPWRLRFEVEETSGNSTGSVQYKLQYRKNTGTWGSWTDVPDIADRWPFTAAPASVPEVYIIDSEQYTDGDATTNLLTGSSEAFVAGEGQEDNLTAAITLANQHTEYEWALVIPKAYTNGINQTTYLFEFRVVESTGTELETYTNVPQVSLSETSRHVGGLFIEQPNRVGPHIDNDGNLYVLTEQTSDDNRPLLWKSSDGGATWVEAQATGRPTQVDPEGMSMWMNAAGTVLHIAHRRGNDALYYHRYHTGAHATTPDTWDSIDIEIEASGGLGTPGNSTDDISIWWREADSRAFIWVCGNDGSNDRIYQYTTTTPDTAASWAQTDLDTATDHFRGVRICEGPNSGDCHIFYHLWTGTTTGGSVFHRTMDSTTGTTASSRQTISTNTWAETGRYSANLIGPTAYDDGGVEVVYIGWLDRSSTPVRAIMTRTLRDGTPQTETQAGDHEALIDGEGSGSRVIAGDLVAYQASKTAHIYYARDNLPTDTEIYEVTSEDEGTWTAADLQFSPQGNVAYVRMAIYTHSAGNGGQTVIGWIHDDYADDPTQSAGITPGLIEYKEELLAAGPTPITVTGTTTPTGANILKPKRQLAGTLTSAGTAILKPLLQLAGTLTSAGAAAKKASQLLTGTLTTAGTAILKPLLQLAGTLTSAGAAAKKASQLLTGTLTTAGTAILKPLIGLAGTLTSSGTVANAITNIKITVTGTLTSAGALAKKALLRQTGATSPTGINLLKPRISTTGSTGPAGGLALRPLQRLAGALTSAGQLVQKPLQALSGTLSASGGVLQKPLIQLAGTVTSAGTAILKPLIRLTGTLTPAGAAANIRTLLVSIAGTLTSAGATIKKALIARAGTLTSSGTASRKPQLTFAGVLTSAGTVAKKARLLLAGTVTSAGTVANTIVNITIQLAGTLTSAGTVALKALQRHTGTVTSAGTTTKKAALQLAGTVTSGGTLANVGAFLVSIGGTLTSAGATALKALKAHTGTLTSAGTVAKKAQRLMVGTLTSAGTVANAIVDITIQLAGTLTAAGTVALKALKAHTGTLTPSGTATKKPRLAHVGAISPTGTALQKARLITAGTLTTAGALLRGPKITPAGTLTPTGTRRSTLIRIIRTGTTTPTGVHLTKARILVAGIISTAGALTNVNLGAIFSGAIRARPRAQGSPAGTIRHQGDDARRIADGTRDH